MMAPSLRVPDGTRGKTAQVEVSLNFINPAGDELGGQSVQIKIALMEAVITDQCMNFVSEA